MAGQPQFNALRAVMAEKDLDAVALVPGVNFRRLTGRDFHQNERPLVLVVTRGGRLAAVVPHLEMASFATLDLDCATYEWRDERGYEAAFASLAIDLGKLGSIGVEGQRMRVFEFLALHRHIDALELVDAHELVSSLRLHKTEGEIASLREAIRISEEALEATVQQVRIGQTETEIEAILVRELFARGAQGLAFDSIVAAGSNSAQPHAQARADYRIRAGDALLFDFGARHGGMNADITRTFFIAEVSDRDRAFYDTVLAANTTARETARAGITASELDDTVQKVLEGSPFAEYRRHKTGHGLGLDVHEAPQIMRGNGQLLEPGMVFTIEPGLYRLGEAGVRIEDDVVVRDDGIEVLTQFPRELRIIGC
ncbi:MAG: Xaa-Pro peptidase family protein [Geminicoccaceae bacterium]